MRFWLNNRKYLVISACICLIVALAIALGIVLARKGEEQSGGDNIPNELSPIFDQMATRKLGAYQLLAQGTTRFNVFYFGDASMYGLGASGEDDRYRVVVRDTLRALYRAPEGTAYLAGRCCNTSVTPSFASGVADFSATYAESTTLSTLRYRLAILAPGEANFPDAVGFGAALEDMIRAIKERAPSVDILLVVPHNEAADSTRAAAILALGEHYGLVTVDMRAAFAADGTLVHTAGENAGLANDAGHAAYAAAIVDAIGAATAADLKTPPLPSARLY